MNEYSPYLAAKKEWLKTYGTYIKREKQWRFVALLSIAIAIFSIILSIISYSKPEFKAFAIKYCDQNGSYSLSSLEEFSPSHDQIKSALASWLIDLREVTADSILQKKRIEKSYLLIEKSSQANSVVNSYLKSNNPFKKSVAELVDVKIKSILVTNNTEYQIDWEENIRSPKSTEYNQTVNYRGRFLLTRLEEIQEKDILQNPLGIKVREVRWSKIF